MKHLTGDCVFKIVVGINTTNVSTRYWWIQERTEVKKGKQMSVNHNIFTYSSRGSYIDVDANIQEL